MNEALQPGPALAQGDAGTRAAAHPLVSVLMPTWGHAAFIARALDSLLAQSWQHWELCVVDDASPDPTADVVARFQDPRIRYQRQARNVGLGAALNRGLQLAAGDLIAYLPSDDLFYAEHLQSLVEALEREPAAVLAYSGVRHHYNRSAPGIVDGYSLQLVQVLHRRCAERWVERETLVTDDLGRMFWDRLARYGRFVGTANVTCEWVDHPGQLHKVLREPVGGINAFRQRFEVQHPLRFHTSVGNPIDEVRQYARYRNRPRASSQHDSLKILLVGELAYNADRVLALEERGHRLYGLWMQDPYWYNTVGPLPFGHVTDLPRCGWQRHVRELRPDIIYALLNWQAVPFAHRVMQDNPGIPFVWHFKEGPFICLEKGTWRELVELYQGSDGCIHSSPEMRDWLEQQVPGLMQKPALVLDGDLPKQDWFAHQRAPRLSEQDGGVHTVVPGRPIGLHPHSVAELKAQGVHLHFYGDFTHGQWREWIAKATSMAQGYLHLHGQVDQDRWVEEFSRYDAGWLHCFRSDNGGDLRRANWDDLNYPARFATLAAAGLPVLQRDNRGSIVATQTLARQLDVGVFFDGMEALGRALRDRERMRELRENMWRQRALFTFDHHVPQLVAFFRQVIARRSGGSPETSTGAVAPALNPHSA